MNFTIQGRSCHAERNEASVCPSRKTLSAAKGDNTVPMLGVKFIIVPLRTSQDIADDLRITTHKFLRAHDFFAFQLQALHHQAARAGY